MRWIPVIKKILSESAKNIFCLHSTHSISRDELHELVTCLNKIDRSVPGSGSLQVMLLSSRARYIRRHRYEGLFFQQRFQASWKDEGETVRDRLSKKGVNSDMETWKDRFDLHELWDKPLLQLSSGEWQRFSLCEGLMAAPDVLIVPELLKGLDQQWQEKIIEILSDKSINQGIIIFTSDKTINHPDVMNIPVGLRSVDPSSAKFEPPPGLLLEAFHHYQSEFLSEKFSDVLIRMDGVKIQYGSKKILTNLHWTVHAGDKWNIRGPNGAGKSTLLSLVNADNPQGYSQPVELFGVRYGVSSIWERKSRIAYFGSDFYQYFRSSGSVADVLKQQLTTPYIDTLQPPHSLIAGVLDYFGLAGLLEHKYSTLPSEVRRQILLTATYLKSSEILVLDEPFQAMPRDQIMQNIRFLESIHTTSTQTVLFVTHREEYKPRFLDKTMEM